MVSKNFVVQNPSGLHVRPAGLLAAGLAHFQSRITLVFQEKEYNAKSPIHLLKACVKQGDTIEVWAEGQDEAQALEEVERLITSGFGE